MDHIEFSLIGILCCYDLLQWWFSRVQVQFRFHFYVIDFLRGGGQIIGRIALTVGASIQGHGYVTELRPFRSGGLY